MARPTSSNDLIRLQPYTGYRSADRLRVSARALQGPTPDFSDPSLLSNVRTMMRLYASREVAGVAVTLRLEGGAAYHATTDEEGYVQFDLPLIPHSRGEMGWEKAVFEWHNTHQIQSVAARIIAPAMNGDLAIISDVDDTILETGITGNMRDILRNVHRIMAQMPQQRRIVPGVPQFYQTLARAGTPQLRPCFYISSSPWNLYPYLRHFKTTHELPAGPLMLRDWTLSGETLGKEGHGTHKLAAIRQLLADFPHLRFVLIGDDTQRDLAAFSAIAGENPDRIAAVFIRRIAALSSTDEQPARTLFEDCNVPFWMGRDFCEAIPTLEAWQLR